MDTTKGDNGREPSFLRTICVLPVAYSLHEAEEWNLLAWYDRYWLNVGDLSDRTVHVWLLFSSLLAFAVTGVVMAFRRERLAAWVLLPFFAFPFLHAFLHIYWVFYFRAYSPGVITSALLLIPSFVFVASRAVRDRLVPAWFVAVACLLNLPPVIAGIRLGNVLPDGGLPWYRFSEKLAEVLLGAR